MAHVFSASFACAVCGNVAAVVSLVPPGAAAPRTGPQTPETLSADSITAQWWRLSIDGGPVPLTHGLVGEPLPVAAALDALDLEALAGFNPEYANFRCPQCRLAYCRDHWRGVHPVFDDGFYDATYGWCPEGHKVMIDD